MPASHHLDVLQTRATLALSLYSRNILLRHCVPCAHVLLHAVCEARLFALGERGAGFRDAALEAVFVQLFDEETRVLHGGFLLDLAHDLHLTVECISIQSVLLCWVETENVRVIGIPRHAGTA
jgi:hypothetical protein